MMNAESGGFGIFGFFVGLGTDSVKAAGGIGRGILGGEEIPCSRFSEGYGYPMVLQRPEVRIYAHSQRVKHLEDDQGSWRDFAHGLAAGHGAELGDDHQHDAGVAESKVD